MVRLFAIAAAFIALCLPVSARECVSVDRITEKAAEFKRPFAFIGEGQELSVLLAVFAKQTGLILESKRAIVIDIDGQIVVGFQVATAFCGFMHIGDESVAAHIRQKAFGARI